MKKSILIIATLLMGTYSQAQSMDNVLGCQTNTVNGLGGSAGCKNTTGSHNNFIGHSAGQENTTGSFNNFLGDRSGNKNTIGDNNNFVGADAGFSNTSGKSNNFVGTAAGMYNTTGNDNNFIGVGAGFNNQAGSGNVFIGYKAGYNEKGSNRLYISNSDTDTPLIYGNFYSKNLGINTNNPKATLSLRANGATNDVGITQKQVGGTSTMELTTDDGAGNQATRLLFRGNTPGANTEFYRGKRGSEVMSMFISGTNGNVGIGTAAPTRKLEVKGEIRGNTFSAVTPPSWPDYVFESDYNLRSLESVENFIKTNKHLPDVPSEAEVTQNGGFNMVDMNTKLLQKVEELTLYLIEQNKKIKTLEAKVGELSKK